MSLPWIELDTDLPDHPKSVQLGILTHEPLAWTHMVALWLWCAKYRPDGKFKGNEAAIILYAAKWPATVEDFLNAAIKAGFIDVTDDGYSIHEVAERLAAHIAKREQDADRKRKHREKIADKYRTSVSRHADVTRTSRGHPEESQRNSNSNSNKYIKDICEQVSETSPELGAPVLSQTAAQELPGFSPSENLDSSQTPEPEVNPQLRVVGFEVTDPDITATEQPFTASEPSTSVAEENNHEWQPFPDAVQDKIPELFEHWRASMGKDKRTKLDAKRRRILEKAMKPISRGGLEATPDEIRLAILGCARSDFHMGHNDRGKKYNDLDLILRDRKRLEEFIEIATGPPQKSIADEFTEQFGEYDKFGNPIGHDEQSTA